MIIQYDLYSQMKAIETIKGTWWPHVQLRFHDAKTKEGTPLHGKEIAIFLGLSTAALLLFIRPRGSSFETPIRFYNRFLERMARAGHPKAPQETGWEFAHRLAAEKPELQSL